MVGFMCIVIWLATHWSMVLIMIIIIIISVAFNKLYYSIQ
jgi:hypothetical protein